MFIDLVDALRCPNPHEDTWLVASADRMEDRDLVEGTLGCPVCLSEYPIRGGIARFGRRRRGTSALSGGPELAVRVAAFLDLTDPRGVALLAGAWAICVPALRRLTPVHLVLLNPTPDVPAGSGISILEADDVIPFADASFRGVALDETHADAALLDAAVRVLRPRGRLVAPASAPTPSGVGELARDASLWVAEREAAPPRLIALRPRRAGGGTG